MFNITEEKIVLSVIAAVGCVTVYMLAWGGMVICNIIGGGM